MNSRISKVRLRSSAFIKLLLKVISRLSLLFIFECCERIIDYPIRTDELNLVINGIINTDSSVIINLSKSIPVLDTNSAPYVGNAQVYLYENSSLAGLMTYQGKGFYALNGKKPQKGLEYKVAARVPDGSEVSSSCIIPEPVAIITIDTIWKIQNNDMSYGTSSYECIITADDPADVPNYYEIKLFHKSMYYNIDSVESTVSRSFFSDDPVFEFYRSGSGLYPLHLTLGSDMFNANSAFFSDDMIDGKRFTFRISLESWNNHGTYYFCLRSLTRDYYLYLRSLMQYNMAEGNYFSERVQIHTNIENGLGILGGYSSYKDSIEINSRYQYYQTILK